MTDQINIPKSFFGGTHITWEDCYSDYNPTEHDVSYWIASLTTTQEVVGTPNGANTGFVFDPSGATLPAGRYKWQILATLKSPVRKYVVASGEVNVKALFEDTNGIDTRTIQATLIAQINDWLKDNVTENEQKITHDGMEVWNYDRQGLLDFRTTLMKELSVIKERERRKRGGGFTKQVRFVTK